MNLSAHPTALCLNCSCVRCELHEDLHPFELCGEYEPQAVCRCVPYHGQLPEIEAADGRIGVYEGFLWKAAGGTIFQFRFYMRYSDLALWEAHCIASDFDDDLKTARDRAFEAFDNWRGSENFAFESAIRCPNCGIAARRNGCVQGTCRTTPVVMTSPLLPFR